MWKKAIFILTIIIAIAIISLCQSVSAIKLTQLTTSETDEYAPVWSPDGSKIAYVGTFYYCDIIWVMDSEGKDRERYEVGPMFGHLYEEGVSLPPSRPTWSPDGKKMVFAHSGIIWLKYPRFPRSATTALTKEDELVFEDVDPSWSPDGIQIAFTSDRSGNKDIWLMKDDGTNLIQLTKHKSVDEHPAWSPDASKIAFTSYRSGNADIWVMDRDSSNLRQLTRNNAKDFYPAWSPDGTKIAFVSDRSGNKDIWIMSSDGKDIIQLTTNESKDEFPTWWPKSSQEKMKIAFTSDRAGNKDIWVLEFTSQELEVPGFEVVFTIAGLLAVAYLLKRR